jgi:helix-turn-helix domain of resolvase
MIKEEIVERLKNLKKIDKAIIILQRKLKELDNNYNYTSVSFEQKVSSSKVNTTEKKLINTLKKKDDIIDQIVTLTEEKFSVTDLINKLEEPEEWLVLRMLYLHGYSVAEVCKEMKVSKATIYRSRDRAVERLEVEVNNS